MMIFASLLTACSEDGPTITTLEPGVIVGFETADGDELAGAILSVGDETVEVDFNHPMAGHIIIFDVEIIDVVPADADD